MNGRNRKLRIDLPDEDGGNVISIEVLRQSRYYRRLQKTCPHHAITIDTALAQVKCKSCGAELNPMETLAMMVEEWHRVQNLYERYKAANELHEKRSRVKCRNCGKLTPIISN